MAFGMDDIEDEDQRYSFVGRGGNKGLLTKLK
jgi:hypothetical protein